MSKWGTVFSGWDERHHVVPVDEVGEVLPPHVLSLECNCSPMRDEKEPELIVHQDPERGGANA